MPNPSRYGVRREQAAQQGSEQTALPDLSALPGVPAGVQGARTALTALHAHPALRRGREWVVAAAAVRAARASAALDGAPLVLEYVVEGARGPEVGDHDPDDIDVGEPEAGEHDVGDPEAGAVEAGIRVAKVVGTAEVSGAITDPRLAGALRVAASLSELMAVWRRAPLQALARLHVLAAADLVEPGRLGRPRLDPGVGPRLTALAAVVTDAPWPAPVMVAVVHGELLALRPFGSADGVVARAAARLVMMTSGLDPEGLGVPEVAFLRAAGAYRAAAHEFGEPEPAGLTAWIVLVCDALIAGAREGRSIADAAM